MWKYKSCRFGLGLSVNHIIEINNYIFNSLYLNKFRVVYNPDSHFINLPAILYPDATKNLFLALSLGGDFDLHGHCMVTSASWEVTRFYTVVVVIPTAISGMKPGGP